MVHWLKNSWKMLSDSRNKGVSLIISMCAIALILGLSLSLIHSSSLPIFRASEKLSRERVYQLTKSFAEVLDAELRGYTTERYDIGENAELVAPEGSFYRYANDFLEGIYREYDPDHPELTTYYYTAATGDEDYGTVAVQLRKTVSEDEDAVYGGRFNFEESSDETKNAEKDSFIRYIFYVDVICTLDGESYTYSTEYYRMDSYVPHYTWNGDISGTVTVYWSRTSEKWFKNSSLTIPIERLDIVERVYDDPNNASIYRDIVKGPESVRIDYAYLPAAESETTYKIFLPTYLEEGAS